MQWRQAIATLGLGLVASLAPEAAAQEEPPADTIPWPARNQLTVTALARLESMRGDTIRLTYSVQSNPASIQPGTALILRRYVKSWLVGSPKRWVGDSTLVQDSTAIIWLSFTEEDMIDPGESLTGFSLAGLGVPDVVTLRVPGDYPAPLYDDTASVQYAAPPPIWTDAAEAPTVGIIPQPAGTPSVLLNRLSGLSSRACELAWVSAPSTCSSLSAKLGAAGTALTAGNLPTARSEVDSYIAELESRRGAEVGESAFALLWPNAKVLRGRMGGHPEGVIAQSEALSSRPLSAAVSAQDVVYVTQLDNQQLSRINLPTLGVAASVGVGSVPTDVSFNAAGTRAYVANQFSQSIGVVDVATNVQVATIGVTGDPFEVIPDVEDTRLYVVTNTDRLYKIDRTTGNALASIAIPGTGQSLKFHPNGYLLYVSTFTGGSALEVDTRTMTVTRTFVTGGKAQEVVVSADGTELFVADQDLQKVDVFSLGTGARITSIPVGGNAWGMAITPDQTQLYVGLLFQGEVVVIDRATRSIVRRIATGGIPRRIVFDQPGTIAVVPNENGFVTYIR